MSNLEIRARQDSPIWKNNSVFIQLLGLSPVLAVSTSLVYGIGLGFATCIVLVLSCFTVSALKNQINNNWRLLWFMLILASYTTIIDIVLQLYYYPLYLSLGIYVPLICCNASILMRMEIKAFHCDWQEATKDAIKTGVGYFIALLLLSALREFASSGSLLVNGSLLLPATSPGSNITPANSSRQLFDFAGTQAGGLLVLGLIVALINFFNDSRKTNSVAPQKETVPVRRARVTDRLIRD